MKKNEAIKKLKSSLNKIKEIRNLGTSSQEFSKWNRDTRVAIQYIFGEESHQVLEFIHISYSLSIVTSNMTERDWKTFYNMGLDSAEAMIQSMISEIQDYWQENKMEISNESQNNNIINKVFIIHGHDSGVKDTIARFLTQIGINPIILHEQPDKGRTIIEKINDYSDVVYAIALLTPDDRGAERDKINDLKYRARQNVIFEFGYFIGKLGRNKVCGIIKDEIEIPSDYSGVLYIPIDNADAWKLRLIKEFKSAGLDIDANKAL